MGGGTAPDHLPTVIMVTAFGREQLLKEARAADIDAILTKPVTPSDLLDTLVRLQTDKAWPMPVREEVFSGIRGTLSPIRGARILLVEDNELNQQVAREFLAKGGLTVSVVGNGQEALVAAQHERFDAILMDLHMPVMDGLEATRRIHALPGLEKLPIIAMTAAAMAQDRAASIEAGMVAHVAKPVDPQELADTLARWVKPVQVGATWALPVADVAPEADVLALERCLPGFSVRQALQRMGGDVELYRELLIGFGERRATAADELMKLLDSAADEQIYQFAHALKGEAGNIGIDAVRDAADSLAKAVRDGEGDRAASCEVLAASCRRAVDLLRGLAASMPDAAPVPDAGPLRSVPPDRILPLLRQLQSLLEARSFRARDVVREAAAVLEGSALSGEFGELAISAQGLHYDAALQKLLALIDKLTRS
jgi:two-component system sensor histidine kinase/response regulator